MQILLYVRLSSVDTRSPQLYHISIITTHVVITRKRCRYNEKICHFNEKRSRYYEKICSFNEKRSHYNEKICRFNEKRSRYYEKRSGYYEKRSPYYEKRSRYNEKRSRYYEKRSRYYDIIEWKNIIWVAVLRHRTSSTSTHFFFFFCSALSMRRRTLLASVRERDRVCSLRSGAQLKFFFYNQTSPRRATQRIDYEIRCQHF